MLRFIVTLALGVGAATAAAAQPVSVPDQVRAALHAFTADAPESGAFGPGYREHVLAGVDGRWTPIPLGAPDMLTVGCQQVVYEITRISVHAMRLHHAEQQPGRELTGTYVSMGGNVFSEQVDPGQYLHWLGLDTVEDQSVRTTALSAINGIATIFRPSPDVLVIQTNYRAPRLYARCP